MAETREELNALIREAIELHIEWMIEDGSPAPKPLSQIDYVEVAA